MKNTENKLSLEQLEAILGRPNYSLELILGSTVSGMAYDMPLTRTELIRKGNTGDKIYQSIMLNQNEGDPVVVDFPI